MYLFVEAGRRQMALRQGTSLRDSLGGTCLHATLIFSDAPSSFPKAKSVTISGEDGGKITLGGRDSADTIDHGMRSGRTLEIFGG